MKFLSTKTMSILTAAALAFSLASCGTVSGTASDTTGTQTTVTQSAESQTETTDTTTTQSTPTPDSQSIDGKSSATTRGDENRQMQGGQRGQKGPMEMNGTPGRITSIEGTTVTVALGQMSGPGGTDNRQAPPDSQNGNQQAPPDLPDGQTTDQQTPPDLPDGQNSDGQRMGGPGFTESGETVTIDLSLITKDGSAVTAEDLSEGDMLILTLDDSGSVTAAQLMGGRGGMDGGFRHGPMDGNAPAGENSTNQNSPDQTTANA